MQKTIRKTSLLISKSHNRHDVNHERAGHTDRAIICAGGADASSRCSLSWNIRSLLISIMSDAKYFCVACLRTAAPINEPSGGAKLLSMPFCVIIWLQRCAAYEFEHFSKVKLADSSSKNSSQF